MTVLMIIALSMTLYMVVGMSAARATRSYHLERAFVRKEIDAYDRNGFRKGTKWSDPEFDRSEFKFLHYLMVWFWWARLPYEVSQRSLDSAADKVDPKAIKAREDAVKAREKEADRDRKIIEAQFDAMIEDAAKKPELTSNPKKGKFFS